MLWGLLQKCALISKKPRRGIHKLLMSHTFLHECQKHCRCWIFETIWLVFAWTKSFAQCKWALNPRFLFWLLKSRLPRTLETGRRKLSRQHSVDENVGRKWFKWLKRPNLNDLHVIAAALQHRISPWRLHSMCVTGLLISHFLTNWKYHAKKLKECEGVLQFHRRKAAGKLGAWRSRSGVFKEQRKH